MVEPRRGPDEYTDTPSRDEAQIRADERADVERELHAMHDDRVERGSDTHVPDTMAVDPRVDQSDGEIEVVRTRSFSFGQLLTMLAGAALVVLGVFALIETGIDTPLDQPVEEVLGYGHTPLLGIVEVAAGALLLLFSLRPGGRWFVALIGVALVLGGVLVLGELDWATEQLGAEQSYAWIPLAAGAIALLSSLLTPRRHQRMTGVPTDRTR